ncbi:phage tail tape measure protein [Mesobacillus subterraneus]|uniref:phage tail tape measure protein n=1 Tax=Mesobacillus subterraneus TaxID=285983 RepID=UPI00203BD050|nr:phage tail tape measure protein [Mesobacillus subterraneus]MCM3573277.1 phage tail tape measure protein [Mesobacillus subterraneus]
MTENIGSLKGQILLEAQQFSKKIEETKNNLKDLSSTAKSHSTEMNNSLQKTEKNLKDISQASEKAARDFNKSFSQVNSSLRDVGLSSDQIDKINKKIKDANPQILENQIKDVRAELTKLGLSEKEIEKITKEMRNADKATQDFGAGLDEIQRISLAMGAAIVTGVGLSVKTAAEFEAQMSRVKGISGATGDEFENLKDKALELGASTSKSASEIALGFEDMAAMGFNATQIIDAMPGVIAAAEASGSDLAKTSGIVAAALNAFQMEASDATKVADILAMTANISAASIDDMGYALKYVGPVANSLGISLEEVSAAIGIMTNAGLDGSSAGTSLRAAILALNNPAKEQEKIMKSLGFSIRDSNGDAKSLSEIFGDLTEATKDMTQADKVATVAKLVGTEAASGMIAVMEGGQDKLDEFTKSLKNSGGASKEAAGIMKDNLKGTVDELMGAFETAGIKLGNEFIPMLTDIVREGAEVVSAIGEMDLSAVKSGLAFAGTASAIALVISSIGKLALAAKTLMVSMGPGGWLIAGLSIVGGLLVATKMNQAELNEVNLESINVLQRQSDSLSKNIEEYERLQSKSHLSNEELLRFLDINSEITKTADPAAIAKLREEQDLLREKSGLSNNELDRMIQLNGDILKVVPESNTVLSEQGNILMTNTDNAKAFNNEQYEMIRLELEAQKAKAESKMKQYLLDEKNLVSEIKGLKQGMIDLDKEEADQVRLIGKIEADLAKAEQEGNETKANQLTYELGLQSKLLQDMKEKKSEQAQLLVEKTKELDKLQQEIGKLDEVKRKMVDIELKQAGINAKRGEEVQSIEAAISKLQGQKRALEQNTPAAQKNSEAYRDGVKQIENQISELNTVKSRILDIIGQANNMNYVLGKQISKTVSINEVIRSSGGARNNIAHAPIYHTGGITGKGQMPTLHVGGLANQFQSAPLHNEVDVRLLRNEMVLTESQQANLMRMIDAGMSGTGRQDGTNVELLAAISRLESIMRSGFNATVLMDGSEVGRLVAPAVNEELFSNAAGSSRSLGL